VLIAHPLLHASSGCGTGRNFSYYPQNVVEIVAVDAVPAMLFQAQHKLQHSKLKVQLQQMDAHHLSFPNQSFDTVVDTFGLCSYEDPIAVLHELRRVCKPDGRIVLIEHGQGSYDWINSILDNGAQRHAHSWGCVWNKDMLALVAKAGLKVVETSRWHFGTTYIIQAKP
jgi:methyltransferase OMS1